MTLARAAAPKLQSTPTVSANRPLVSVLVPARDEAESLPLFLEEAARSFASEPGKYEVIVIDDGSGDATWEIIESLTPTYSFLRSARHRTSRGIADALRTGYLASRGSVLVFYPADLQYRPEDIPRLVEPVLNGSADMVAGFKEGEYEKAFVSGVYNRLSRSLFNVPVRDLNSVKAYSREVMESLPLRPDWHRYMVVMAAAQGFTVTEIPVPLYPRHAGKSKFGLGRIPVGALDMLAVWFELRFAKKPLLLFGILGAALFIIGTLVGIFAVLWRIFAGEGFRPLINLVETCLLLGSVFFATGLIGELIAAQRAEMRELRARLDELAQSSESFDKP
jgi:glycosyltransferase involved in cell wall biosynthesis